MFYIYLILNKINYKAYIGQTKTPFNRWSAHKCEAKNNRLRFPIHKAINKYGVENFQFNIIEICSSVEEADLAEIYWIQQFDSRNNNMGYNLAIGGNVNRGWHHTDESKKKIKEHNIGKLKPHSEKWISDRIGKKASPETKKKMSQTRLNSSKCSGYHLSDETKQKMSQSKKISKFKNSAKLNWDIVNKIRQEYNVELFPIQYWADKYNVTTATIKNILKYNTWIN